MNEQSYIELIRKAQRGDKKALNSLAESAAERLRVYVYRLTLADDPTQEIVQETMLEMCRILGKLKDADKFWPWLYGIATNKIHRHHRAERTQKGLAKSKVARATLAADRPTPGQREHGLQNLVTQELKQIVAAAMQSLKTRHRAVLVMRCYDQMSYAEIAESMGCSEFSTRMLFLRAKRALRKQLSRNGFGRGSLLAALVLFGKMTAPTEAAAVVFAEYLPVIVVIVTPRVGGCDTVLLLNPPSQGIVGVLGHVGVVDIRYSHNAVFVVVFVLIAVLICGQIACGVVGDGIAADAVVAICQVVDVVVHVISIPHGDRIPVA